MTATSFSVPHGSPLWRARLEARRWRAPTPAAASAKRSCASRSVRAGHRTGRHHPRQPPAVAGGGADAATAIHGLHSVTMAIRQPPATLELMTRTARVRGGGRRSDRVRLAVERRCARARHRRAACAEAPHARNGLGTVHHVAMAIGSAEEQLRAAIGAAGGRLQRHRGARSAVLPVDLLPRARRGAVRGGDGRARVSRSTSRWPSLGRGLKLPPWEEPHRSAIEAGLPEIVRPGSIRAGDVHQCSPRCRCCPRGDLVLDRFLIPHDHQRHLARA